MKFENKVTTVNFILAIIVVLLHSQNILIYEDVMGRAVHGGEHLISNIIGDLAVPSFFLISSYLFYRNYGKDKILSKYKSRIRSVFIPYLLWNVMYYVAFVILTRLPVICSIMTTQKVPISFAEFMTSMFFYKYNGVYWFMYQLILFIIISPIIYAMISRKAGIFVLVILYLVNFGIARFPALPQGIHLDMLLFWCIGCYFAVHKSEMFERVEAGKNAVVCMSAAVVLIIVRFVLEFHEIVILHGSFVLYNLLVINVVVLWFGMNILRYEKTCWQMKITFFIYSMHPLLVDFIKKGLAAVLPHNQVVATVNYFLAAGISLLIVFGTAKVLKKLCPTLWGILNGGRKV